MNPATNQSSNSARAAILKSISDHLAESARHELVIQKEESPQLEIAQANGKQDLTSRSLVRRFSEQLEAVGAHCIIASSEPEAASALKDIFQKLQTDLSRALRIALSNAPILERLMRAAGINGSEITISPSAADLFGYDVGLTTAQAAIAETGTLVLESNEERHRLVSLLPPVHVAFIDAANICATLGEALREVVRKGPMGMSRAITFITGPSRTADIELTLTIGVHGPKELYVIVNDGSPLINQ